MDPIRRKRPFLPKTKTGCMTCKIRKIKCDEAKPYCNRCSSTGRKCDGYSPPPSTPSPKSSGGIQDHPDLFASVAEQRSFSFFQSRASPQLAGQFHLQFWSNEVLQAALHYPPVRHLIIAVGAAYESYEHGDSEALKLLNNKGGMQLAMQQCNQAIRRMDDLFQSQSHGVQTMERTCCILTASILFAYLASLQGNLLQAIQHARSGLKVLQDFEANEQLHGARSPSYPVPVLRLRTLLISIYGQVRTIINDEALLKWDRDPLDSHLEPVSYFVSVEEAHGYVERLFHNMQAFLQSFELHPPRSTEEMESFASRRRAIKRAWNDSCVALELLASQQPTESRPRINRGITILRIYHILIEMRLVIGPLQQAKRESSYDRLETQLEQILTYCEQLVQDGQSVSTLPSCSSGLGYILPLHTVAARCRNPRHRRKALDLLLSTSRRECIWDSILTGRIATKTLEIEEQASLLSVVDGQSRIADDARVREAKVTFTDERKAMVQYITVGNWKRAESGRHHIIEW